MKYFTLLICLFISVLANAQVQFVEREEGNLRMSDGAKAIVNSIDKLIRHPSKCPSDSNKSAIPYVFSEMPTIFLNYLVFNADDHKPTFSFATFFDAGGKYSSNHTTNEFGIAVSGINDTNLNIFSNVGICNVPSVKKFAGSVYGFNNWRFRLIKESDLITRLNPQPDVCSYSANNENDLMAGLYTKTLDLPAVNIGKDIDVTKGVIKARLKIPFNDPIQWAYYDNFQNIYGLVLTLCDAKTHEPTDYYLVSNYDNGPYNLMKQVQRKETAQKKVGPIQYGWKISAAADGVINAINQMIKNPVTGINPNLHTSCGSVPIAYLFPQLFDPGCKPIQYKFQLAWNDTFSKPGQRFFINVNSTVGPCMFPDFEVPCNYSCLPTVDPFSNNVWSLRIIEENRLKKFLSDSSAHLNFDEGNLYELTTGLPAIDLIKDINRDTGITQKQLDFFGDNTSETNYCNYPYNSLGIKLTFLKKNGGTIRGYLVSDYDGSGTILWKEVAGQ